MRKTFAVSLLILCAFWQSAAQAADEDIFAAGLQLYQNGQYLSAYNEFHRLAEDSNNPEAHYLLAITMVKMNDVEGGIKQYQRTISLDPDGWYGQAARAGLRGVGAQANSAPANANITTMQDSMNAIRQETHGEKQAKSADARVNVKSINQTAEGTARNLAKTRDDVAAQMAGSTFVTRDGCVLPRYTPAQIGAVENRYNDQISAVHSQGATDAAQAHANGKQTMQALRESAHSLYSQLQDPNAKGEHLVPQGTNLYVRNYSSK